MAKELTIQQKKEWAQLLYTRENLTQKEVAARVGTSAQSLTKWVHDGKWDQLKISLSITREEQIQNLYRQLAEINISIATREEGHRFPNAKEADTINKLASAIEKMERETGVADIISVAKDCVGWIRKFDIEKAKGITALFDGYIKTKLK